MNINWWDLLARFIIFLPFGVALVVFSLWRARRERRRMERFLHDLVDDMYRTSHPEEWACPYCRAVAAGQPSPVNVRTHAEYHGWTDEFRRGRP